MTAKKEYTLVINGVDVAIKDVTTLGNAIEKLNKAVEANREVSVKAAATTKARAKALTDEEKAAKKLEETQRKTEAALKGLNDEQIKANQLLREATREQSLRIKSEQAEANSIEEMRVKLSQLKNEWKQLDVGTEQFHSMSGEIRELNDRIKEAEQSTGDFRRNVGNYGSALDGLGKLSDGINGVTKSSMGMAQGLLGASMLMGMFGSQSEEGAEQTKQLQKIIALLSIAQQVNTNVLKEGIVQNKLSAVTDSIRTAQLKAKTAAEVASTKGTVAATVAQRIFNAVAAANPYILLAMALAAVGAALFAFASNTDKAAEKQKKLNALQNIHLDTLESGLKRIKDNSNERSAAMERELREMKAQGASLEEIHKKENEIAAERRRNNDEQQKGAHIHLKYLDQNKYKLRELQLLLQKAKKDKLNGIDIVTLEVEGKKVQKKIDKAIDDIQGEIDNLGRSVQIATELKTEGQELDSSEKELAERQKRELQERAKASAEAAKQRAEAERAIIRAAEDAKVRLIQDKEEQARMALELSYTRQIEDLQKRLDTETDLTPKARSALNETILNLEMQKDLELDKLKEAQAERALALQREVEDSRISIMASGYEKQTAEVSQQYERQIEAYKKRLKEDVSLTEEQQRQITELILNAQKARSVALARLENEQLNQRADLHLSAVENALKETQDKIGEVVERNQTGLELIDVGATRKNLEETNAALDEYLSGLESYLREYQSASDAVLATMQEGTTEYEAELQKRARAEADVTQKIKNAQREQAVNTKKSADIQIEAMQELFGKIAEYANAAVTAINAVMDTWNMSLQIQLDSLNEKADIVNERYDEIKKQREEAVSHVERLENQLQEATGGTAEALKEQLQDSMHARAEAEREEKRITKEKERLEAEIAKKEKQMRRNDLVSKIAQSVANTALE